MAKSHARIRAIARTDQWSAKINVSMIAKRLNDHLLGKIQLESTQIQAARILMDKLVSNAPTKITGGNGEPLLAGIKVTFVGNNSTVPGKG